MTVTAARPCLVCNGGPHSDRASSRSGHRGHAYDPGDRRVLPAPASQRVNTGHLRRWDDPEMAA